MWKAALELNRLKGFQQNKLICSITIQLFHFRIIYLHIVLYYYYYFLYHFGFIIPFCKKIWMMISLFEMYFLYHILN